MTTGEQFFRGTIREPDGPGERVVFPKGARALAERVAAKEADRLGWDWIVAHCRVDGSGDDLIVTVIEQWSSVGGHEVFE